MNAVEIDELLDAFRNNDLEKICGMVGVEGDGDNIFTFWNQNVEQIMKKIGNEIKKGDYDYFYSKKNEKGPNSIDFWTIYLSFAEEQEIKSIVEDQKQLEQLRDDGFFISQIVGSINDVEYIKQLIERKEELHIRR